jgi:hypothetical protein
VTANLIPFRLSSERLAFGSDRVACEAAKREVFAAAGYPVWNLPSEESMEEGW